MPFCFSLAARRWIVLTVWLITSELANQHVPFGTIHLYMCGIYINYHYHYTHWVLVIDKLTMCVKNTLIVSQSTILHNLDRTPTSPVAFDAFNICNCLTDFIFSCPGQPLITALADGFTLVMFILLSSSVYSSVVW